MYIYILYFFRDKKELNSWISPPVLESIQARVRVFLALRTVTSNRGLLADRTARLGAKKLLRALEAALAAYLVGDFWILLAQRLSEARAGHLGYAILCVLRVSNVLKGWEFKTTHIHTSKQIERKSPCFPGTTCRTKDLTGAVITSVLVFVAAVRTMAVIIIYIVLADNTPIVADKDPDGAGREHGKTGWGSQPVGPMGHLQNPPGSVSRLRGPHQLGLRPPPGRWIGEPVWLSVCRVTHEYHECRSTLIMDEERQIVWLNQTPNQTKATSKVTGAILAAPLRVRFICAVARTVAMAIFHEGLGICVQPLLGRTAPNTAGRCWCSRKNRRSSWYNPSSPVTRTDTQFQWISINFPISPLTHPINQYPHLQLIYLWFIMISQWHFVMIWSYSRFSEPAVLISAALWAIATSIVDLPPRKQPWSAGQANEKTRGLPTIPLHAGAQSTISDDTHVMLILMLVLLWIWMLMYRGREGWWMPCFGFRATPWRSAGAIPKQASEIEGSMIYPPLSWPF